MQRHGVSIAEAAVQIGKSPDTVRRRLVDGKISGEKIDGVWVAYLEVDPELETASRSREDDELRLELRQRISSLERVIEAKDQQIAELHQLLARATPPALPEGRTWWSRLLRR